MRWEYKIISFGMTADPEAELNKLGKDGWEAVATISSVGLAWDHKVIMKRRRRKEPT